MYLREIKLTNFRNYSKINLKLNNKINIFIGNNGEGKTNLLESIHVLSLTKSHRLLSDFDLIQTSKLGLKIEGKVAFNEQLNKRLQITINKEEKKVFINNSRVNKLTEYISYLDVIIFTPDDLEIIKGSPSKRRKYFNISISQIELKYANYLNQYNKILKMRNEYFRNIKPKNQPNDSYFQILTEKLAVIASNIYYIRINYVEKYNKYIDTIYFDLTNIPKLKIKYRTNLNFDINSNIEEIKELYLKKLKELKVKELFQNKTLFGPHRDDFIFYLGKDDLSIYGSQGQQRILVIALKLTELYIYQQLKNETPILLLDDIFSEIDIQKKNRIIKYLNNDIQIIITTTDIKNISKKILKTASIYKVTAGEIIKEVQNGK